MPQEIKVFKCYKCNIYQSQIAKKASQWVCSVCGEKQSIKFCYGAGTGKDCRMLVQKLNENHLTSSEANIEHVKEDAYDDNHLEGNNAEMEIEEGAVSHSTVPKDGKVSKWLKYLDTAEDSENI